MSFKKILESIVKTGVFSAGEVVKERFFRYTFCARGI